MSAASADELWIGLNDVRTEGLFDWSDSSTVTFTSWEYGKPAASSDTEDCVLIRGEVRQYSGAYFRLIYTRLLNIIQG